MSRTDTSDQPPSALQNRLENVGLVGLALTHLLFGLWVLKDLALFPVTRIAYERGGRPHGADALLGATGVAREGLTQGRVGYVRVGPELWRARLAEDTGELPEGTSVRVVAVRDLTLVVERAGS